MLGYDDLDFWVGYTSTSYLAGLFTTTRFHRRSVETNYEPEAMLVWRTDYSLAGLRGVLHHFGLVHQSNGRAEDLSRS